LRIYFCSEWQLSIASRFGRIELIDLYQQRALIRRIHALRNIYLTELHRPAGYVQELLWQPSLVQTDKGKLINAIKYDVLESGRLCDVEIKVIGVYIYHRSLICTRTVIYTLLVKPSLIFFALRKELGFDGVASQRSYF